MAGWNSELVQTKSPYIALYDANGDHMAQEGFGKRVSRKLTVWDSAFSDSKTRRQTPNGSLMSLSGEIVWWIAANSQLSLTLTSWCNCLPKWPTEIWVKWHWGFAAMLPFWDVSHASLKHSQLSERELRLTFCYALFGQFVLFKEHNGHCMPGSTCKCPSLLSSGSPYTDCQQWWTTCTL